MGYAGLSGKRVGALKKNFCHKHRGTVPSKKEAVTSDRSNGEDSGSKYQVARSLRAIDRER